jgi:Asp/Glu/hydantoin racemase
LLLNPNTTAALTDRMAGVARTVASPGTTIETATAPRGFPYISSRAEAQVAGAVALEMMAERRDRCDAVVMAAFGDPGLWGLRELLDVPVVGMAEAAMLTACLIGRRFALLTFAAALEPWYRDLVEANGLSARCAGVSCAQGRFSTIDAVQDEMARQLVDAAHDCVRELRPDVIVLAGAPLSGLAPLIRDEVPVPLVDGIAAAVRQAETLASLRPAKARAGAFARPAPKESSGLDPALAAWIAGR